jgi:hypothetical protein
MQYLCFSIGIVLQIKKSHTIQVCFFIPAEMGSRGNPLQVYQQFFRKKNILV